MNFQEIIDAVNLELGTCIRLMKDGYEIEEAGGSELTRASSGRPRIRRLYEQTEYTFTVPVGPMPRAAVASVEGKQAVMQFEFTGSKLL